MVKRVLMVGAVVVGAMLAQPKGGKFDPAVVKAEWLKSAQKQAEVLNAGEAAKFAQAASNWKEAATQARDYGLALPEKPVPPPVLHVVAGQCTTQWPPSAGQDGCPVDVYGPELVAQPVPDLPEIVVPPIGNVHIDTSNCWGVYCRAFPDDTAKDGQVVLVDGVHYQKEINPFGGLYRRLDNQQAANVFVPSIGLLSFNDPVPECNPCPWEK